MNNKGKYKTVGILTVKEHSDKFDGYYVYRHILNDEVIYVGKGSKRRIFHGNREYDINIVEKEIVRRFEDEGEALKFEEQLIKYYISIGQCKYNSQNSYFTGLTREITTKKSKRNKKKKCKKNKKNNIKNKKEISFNKKVDEEYEKMFKYRI